MRPILFIFPSSFPLLGDQVVYTYGVFFGLALLLGWYITLHQAARQGMSRDRAMAALAVSVLAGIFAARGLFFITNPSAWTGPASLVDLDTGGLVVYGGLLGGMAGAVVSLRVLGLDFWKFSDLAAPQLALGVSVGRIGCWFYGCDFGQMTQGWGVRFPRWTQDHLPGVGQACAQALPCSGLTKCDPVSLLCVAGGSPAFAAHRRLGLVESADLFSLAVHPVQLYAAFGALILCVVLHWVYKRRRFDGQVVLVFLGVYGAMRFFLETLRGDPQRGTVWVGADGGIFSQFLVKQQTSGEGALAVSRALTTSQFISLSLIILVVSLSILAWRRPSALGMRRVDSGKERESSDGSGVS